MLKNLRFLTAGESHGPALTVIVEGIPAGLSLTFDDLNEDLRRRQLGYGRSLRMQKIEQDFARFLSGVRYGKTIGSPITVVIENLDFENWQISMSVEPLTEDVPLEKKRSFFTPRPGHADLAGAIKYNTKDLRPILERASARETASRVAVGAIAKKLVGEVGVQITSHVLSIGSVKAQTDCTNLPISEISKRAEASKLRCLDPEAEIAMIKLIDEAMERGDSLGGVFEVIADGLPIGLGSHVQWDRRLDGLLAQAVMSIPAVKGVEIGGGFGLAGQFGSQVHDEFLPPDPKASQWRFFVRKSNNAGGLEGGMTNGERLIVRGAMKPLSTLRHPLQSFHIQTLAVVNAHFERSDVCAVPSASVVAEAMVALVLADTILEKFGGDSMTELKANITNYRQSVVEWLEGGRKKDET